MKNYLGTEFHTAAWWVEQNKLHVNNTFYKLYRESGYNIEIHKIAHISGSEIVKT